MNRKSFIKNSAIVGAGGLFLPSLKSYALSKSTQNILANDQINIEVLVSMEWDGGIP